MYSIKKLAKNVCADSLQRNSLYLILNAGIGSIFGFVFWMIVARYYTTSEVGLASATVSASIMIATLSNLGFNVAIIRYLPSAKEKGNELINSFMTVSGIVSILLSIIFLININFISKNLAYLHSSHWHSLAFIVFTVCFLLVPMQDAMFIAIRKSEYVVFKNLILGTRIIFPLFLLSFGAIGIFLSYGIAYVIVILISTLLLMPRAIRGYFPDLYIDYLLIRETFHFSIGNYVGGFFELAPGLLLPIIITNVLDLESTAYFYIAWTITSILYTVSRSIATSLFAEGSHENVDLYGEIKKSVRISLFFIIPAVTIVYIASGDLLNIFGKDYSTNGAKLLQILAISAIPLTINTISTTVWRIQKKITRIILLNLSIVIFTLVGGYILVSYFELIGFGISWLIAHVIISLVNSILLFYRTPNILKS